MSGKAGRFVIVGTGPGDPSLLTQKAITALSAADVIAYPQTSRGSFAARTAQAHIGGATHLPFTVPMTGDGAAEAAYDGAAAAVAAHLDAGRSVALLCEGDPMLYGSAASLMDRLAHRCTPEIVPGVTAAAACAAAAGTSLVRGEAPLTILPATADAAVLKRALRSPQALVLYKVGRHFDTVAALVRAAGRTGTLVCRGTLADETVSPLADAPGGPKPYFSTIILPAAAPVQRTSSAACAIVALTASALPAAQKAKAALTAGGHAAQIHGLARRVHAADVLFADAIHHVGALFEAGTPIVGLCAAGILIRATAPYLSQKTAEPPVVALSEDGAAIVPLLGTHQGGAAIARTLGEAFAVTPAFTTRSEAVAGFALDDPPPGWVVADLAPFKTLAAALPAEGDGHADDALTFLPSRDGWPSDIRATIGPGLPDVPTYIARRVVIGMGAERGASPQAAIALAHRVLAEQRIDPRAVAVVASLDKKADEPALHGLADALGAPFRVFDTDALAAQEPSLSRPSEVVRAAVGVAGVAEAAALAAAGEGATLVVPKTVEGQLTIAVATAPSPIVTPPGRAQGHLAIVGIGPGTGDWRTAECVALLAKADAFVGYSLYLDLVEDLRATQSRHDFALGDEAARTRFALELAGEGRTVALISSGDAGIYAMATLATELLDTGGLSDAACRVALTVAPGISAAQAAAARTGAPLGHDFAFISLSDLLTPWPAIERRLRAAAEADFAVALYNPRSRRRTAQLEEAKTIFAAARPPDTPVIIAASLGRPAETVTHTTIAELDPAAVDMLATVIIGASTTRRFTRGDGCTLVYTPRGYEVLP